MKKSFALFAIIAFVAVFTACKKEYECCYYDSAGVKIGTGIYGCVTEKMSKKDMQQLEDDMNSVALLWSGSAKCE